MKSTLQTLFSHVNWLSPSLRQGNMSPWLPSSCDFIFSPDRGEKGSPSVSSPHFLSSRTKLLFEKSFHWILWTRRLLGKRTELSIVGFPSAHFFKTSSSLVWYVIVIIKINCYEPNRTCPSLREIRDVLFLNVRPFGILEAGATLSAAISILSSSSTSWAKGWLRSHAILWDLS